MERIVKSYHRDIEPLNTMNILDFFNFVRAIPYKEDFNDEILDRPRNLLKPEIWEGLDCKKKSILMASYLHNRGLKWSFIAVSEAIGRPIHHVYCLLKYGNKFFPLDATYENSSFLKINPVFEAEIIGGNYD